MAHSIPPAELSRHVYVMSNRIIAPNVRATPEIDISEIPMSIVSRSENRPPEEGTLLNLMLGEELRVAVQA
jgi:hypothetical protein